MIIDTRKILSLYGLQFNPFDTEKPTSAIFVAPRLSKEIWRIENLVMDGGISSVIGPPGSGKSAFLRHLSQRLSEVPDVQVARMDRPQSSLADFYRELGDVFKIHLKVSCRWGGFRSLREKWAAHIQTTMFRPVLIIDEAQLMLPQTLTELRLLSSENFDSHKLLTIVLAGDNRLGEKLESPELLPLKSRIQTRIEFGMSPKDELENILRHVLDKAGNAALMSEGLIVLLAEQSCGNPRTMMQTAIDIAGKALDNSSNTNQTYVVEGETNLVRYDETTDRNQLQTLLDVFSRKREMLGLLDRCIDAEGVKIFIGHEAGFDGLGNCSVITSPYSINGEAVGVLGVIGPTRINYDKVIPVVDMTAKLLGEALNL